MFQTYDSQACFRSLQSLFIPKTSPLDSPSMRPETAGATDCHPQSWPNASVVLPILPVDGQPDIPRGSHPDWLRRTGASYEGTS